MRTIAILILWTPVLALLPWTAGCVRARIEHEVKPIHITVDVNLRVQKELDTLFEDIDAQDPTIGNSATE